MMNAKQKNELLLWREGNCRGELTPDLPTFVVSLSSVLMGEFDEGRASAHLIGYRWTIRRATTAKVLGTPSPPKKERNKLHVRICERSEDGVLGTDGNRCKTLSRRNGSLLPRVMRKSAVSARIIKSSIHKWVVEDESKECPRSYVRNCQGVKSVKIELIGCAVCCPYQPCQRELNA
jgi:hypothetical protein